MDHPKDHSLSLNHFARHPKPWINFSICENIPTSAFKTVDPEEGKFRYIKSKENTVTVQHRIELIREEIEDKELECLRVYEECMKGSKQYKKEFVSTIKNYNEDLIESFKEVKAYAKPPIRLIEDIIKALQNNYAKFETFHSQEILFKDSMIDKISSELKETQQKLDKALAPPDNDLSSYE